MHNAARLAKVSKLLRIPLIATQYASFGPIAQKITENHDETLKKVYSKKTFSVTGESFISKHLKSLKRNTAVVYGIDTVVCILQTCKDLLDLDYKVFVVVDAVSSFQVEERNTGLQMIR